LTQKVSRGIKTYSERRIDLQNLQMLEKSIQFLSSEQPCEPKSLDFALNITEVREYSDNLQLQSKLEAFN